MFYLRLAFSNLKKNARSYIPYILTCTLTVAMYYIMKSLSLNKGLSGVWGSETVTETLSLGCWVITVFAFLFLFYTNSFLIKQRKKEFGLFNVLGMEKSHIGRIVAIENLIAAVISLVSGFGAGMLLDKLIYLLLIKLLGFKIALGFYISVPAVISTLILFGVIFVCIMINSLRIIHRSKPVELLHGSGTGEREPKAKWLIALLGLCCISVGYYMALTVENPVKALAYFFIAVILVIVGTYLMFTAVSIAFLKLLKKNKRYYYKTNHFISVSGMIYRMKQNAVGLANICILSTMVLVMVSSTSSLIVGVEDIINTRYPKDFVFYAYNTGEEQRTELIESIEKLSAEEGISATDQLAFSSLTFAAVDKGKGVFEVNSAALSDIEDVCELNFITDEDYSSFIGESVSLNEGEVIVCGNSEKYSWDSFELFGKNYSVRNVAGDYPMLSVNQVDICPTFGVVVCDYDKILQIYEEQKKVYGDSASRPVFSLLFNSNASDERQIEFAQTVSQRISEQNQSAKYRIRSREEQRQGIYNLYGSLFFLGSFLAILFTVAAVLIIYYKQVSEGYDDKRRFEIMQQVGLTRREVKQSIHSQVLTVFFLPLLVAGLHTAVSFPMINKILRLMSLTNTKLFVICSIVSFSAFALIYGIVYLLTARVYYKIVENADAA